MGKEAYKLGLSKFTCDNLVSLKTASMLSRIPERRLIWAITFEGLKAKKKKDGSRFMIDLMDLREWLDQQEQAEGGQD